MTKEKAISILREQYDRYHGSSEMCLDKALKQAIIELEGFRCDWCGSPLGNVCISSDHVHMYCGCSCENYGADRRRIEALEEWKNNLPEAKIIGIIHRLDGSVIATIELKAKAFTNLESLNLD